MIRLLGFIVGSAVSIGVFLLILGIPDINLSESGIGDEQIESISQKTRDLKQDLNAIAEEIKDQVADDQAVMTGIVGKPQQADSNAGETFATEEPLIVDLPPEPEPLLMPADTAQDNLKWHAFWNPFRSRIAAEGFVKQLEKVTGLDYRVVKIKTGVYEVTFAYEDDDERRDKMSLIASATGLDLPDS